MGGIWDGEGGRERPLKSLGGGNGRSFSARREGARARASERAVGARQEGRFRYEGWVPPEVGRFRKWCGGWVGVVLVRPIGLGGSCGAYRAGAALRGLGGLP